MIDLIINDISLIFFKIGFIGMERISVIFDIVSWISFLPQQFPIEKIENLPFNYFNVTFQQVMHYALLEVKTLQS